MKRVNNVDKYYMLQPPLKFVEELKKPVHDEKPKSFGTGVISDGEANANGIYIKSEFPDEKGLLKTMFDDFARFANLYGIGGQSYPVVIRKGETPVFEAYSIDVKEDECVVTANDTEGARRAIIYIEDEIRRRENAFLPIGRIQRKPYIKTRMTRGFFSPTNRPPKNGDELFDDIDYYPDEYLNRLAHDGTNGLWIYTSFAQLLPSKLIAEYGVGSEKRIAKLRKIIAKCALYGIKVYVFAIEPRGLLTDEMDAKYPQVLGRTDFEGRHGFCTRTEFGKAYCEESMKMLFDLFPDLGGFITISYGERTASCPAAFTWDGSNDCPRCGHSPDSEVLAEVNDVMMSGVRKSKPEAEYISWTYGHRDWEIPAIQDYVEKSPKDVIIMQNFDDKGEVEQLGKTRLSLDYWLSYAGPSEMYIKTAEKARETGKPLYAKMQVCCSHEVASVPYIPVPGLIYEKFKGARELGTTGVMESWYFGNYPSLMSKAAGEMSFIEDMSDKKAFLKSLAGIYWGNSKAEKVASAWEKFEEGYVNFPVNIMFSYYGPMHDSVSWDLSLKPKNFCLPRSWQLTDIPDGDRIGECLLSGHTLEEGITLCNMMSSSWKEGIEIMRGVNCDSEEERKQNYVAEALQILFEAGTKILEFYKLRDMLGRQEGNAIDVLNDMKGIVLSQKELSQKMISLCEKDSRLGYHSEAEGYKFFPEKLKERIEKLDALLETEFKEVEERINSGKTPLEYYDGVEPDAKSYKMAKELSEAPFEFMADGVSKFRAAYDEEKIYFEFESPKDTEFLVSPEWQLMWPAPPAYLCGNGDVRINNHSVNYQIYGDRIKKAVALWHNEKVEGEGTHIKVWLWRKEIGWTKDTPLKLRIELTDKTLWCTDPNAFYQLAKDDIVNGEYGWLMP